VDIDWAPNTNRILTTSQDRNAYVWNLEGNDWKPALVLLKINRAATSCRWSVEENKFAVGSGGKVVSVCFFDKENNWWVAKQMKKNVPHTSTITTVAYHPTDNLLMATGSTDFHARLFSTFLKDVDAKEKRAEFAQIKGDWNTQGWVHDVVFSPNGDYLAFVGHDAVLYVVECANASNLVAVPTNCSPFKKALWLSDSAIVVGGHDFTPVLFSSREGSWKCYGKAETTEKPKEEKRGVGTTVTTSTESQITSRHKNCINSLAYYKKSGGKVSDFVTGSLDGRVLFWKVADLEKSVQGFQA